MNKQELVDLVKLNLGGGDASAEVKSRFHPKEIAKYIEMVYDDIFHELCVNGIKYGDFSPLDNYVLTYVLPIAYDNAREQYYTVLNPQPVPMPNNQSIRQVSPPKQQTLSFAPVTDNSSSVWAALEVDYVDSTPGYSVEGNNIYYDDKFPKGLENIMVKQIVPFSNLKDTDSVFVPGGNNTVMFQKVVALMMGKPMPDLQGSNENVTKT